MMKNILLASDKERERERERERGVFDILYLGM